MLEASLRWLRHDVGPITLNTLDDHLKMVCGRPYNASLIDAGFPRKFLPSPKGPLARSPTLDLQNLKLLVALYVAVCQKAAYADGDSQFDLPGLFAFVMNRLALTKRETIELTSFDPASPLMLTADIAAAAAFGEGLQTAFGSTVGKIDITGEKTLKSALTSAYLNNTELDFYYHTCDGADFTGTCMDGAHLRDGTLNNCVFGNTSMVGTHFDSMTFKRCTFPPTATFRNAIFTNCRFEDCRFNGCDLSAVKLHSGTMHKCRLSGCSFRRAEIGNNGSDSNFRASQMSFCFENTTLLECRLDSTAVNRAGFDQCVFRNTAVEKSRFSSSDLNDCQLPGCKVVEVQFEDVSMLRSSWAGSNFKNTQFRSCILTGTQFNRVQMTETDFGNCAMSSVNFRGCKGADLFSMANRDFKDRDLEGAILGITSATLLRLGERGFRQNYLGSEVTRNTALGRMFYLAPKIAEPMLVQLATALLKISAESGHANDDTMTFFWTLLSDRRYVNLPALAELMDRQGTQALSLLNERGLDVLPSHDGNEALALTATRIAQRLSRLSNEEVRGLSPLVCQIRAAVSEGRLVIDKDILKALSEAHARALPVGLERDFTAVFAEHLSGPDARHLTLVTEEGDRAIVLAPESASILLGDSSEPGYMQETQYYPMVRGIDGFEFSSEKLAQTAASFPLLSSRLAPRGAGMASLLDLYALPDDLRRDFSATIRASHKRDLTGLLDQKRLTQVFGKLTSSPGRPTTTLDAGKVTLLPHHIVALQAAFARIYPGKGDGRRTAHILDLLARAFFHAASSAVFGTELESPYALRHYALAAFNAARFARDPSFSGDDFTRDIASRTIGDGGAFTCAGMIASTLSDRSRATMAARDADDLRFEQYLLPEGW